MAAVRHVSDDERRARIAQRHGIAPSHRYADPTAATAAMTVLHATEPATVYLSLLARVDGLTVQDVDTALYGDRSLVKQLAMRRTVFVFPRDLLPAAWGSASARVAGQLRPRLVKEVEQHQIAEDGEEWLRRVCTAVVELLADGQELSAQAIRQQVPGLEGRLQLAAGKKYAANVPISPRVLTQLGVEARIARGRNGGHWRTSRPQWTSMESWLGDPAVPWKADEGWVELVRRWLWTFGPGTSADIQWWLGGTVAAVKQALATLGAEPVSLDAPGGSNGWLLPDDLDEVTHPGHWAALLPVLDPTVMGWKERGFYLGPHAPQLFDSNGNAGTTAWWDGRIVGCWVQDPGGVVEVRYVDRVPKSAEKALRAEADRLTDWLDGVRVSTVYPSAAMRS